MYYEEFIPEIIIDRKDPNFFDTNKYENNFAFFFGDNYGSFINYFEISYQDENNEITIIKSVDF